MRKLAIFMMTSVDGYYEGPGHDIDWHRVDEEFNDFAVAQLKAADVLLFGRVTYELMASYWPTAEATTNDPEVAGLMNAMPKLVVSRTLAKADWSNTRLIKDNLAAEITALKQQPGQDLLILGSSDLSVSLAELDLIDDYRIMISSIALGRGKSVFQGLRQPLDLKLAKSRTFGNGNVLLHYEPVR